MQPEILVPLVRGVSKAVACFPRPRNQDFIETLLRAGVIGRIYNCVVRYRRGLWVLPARRSCNQRKRSPRDRNRGGCQQAPRVSFDANTSRLYAATTGPERTGMTG